MYRLHCIGYGVNSTLSSSELQLIWLMLRMIDLKSYAFIILEPIELIVCVCVCFSRIRILCGHCINMSKKNDFLLAVGPEKSKNHSFWLLTR